MRPEQAPTQAPASAAGLSLADTVLLEQFADVQGGSSVASGGAGVAPDLYSLCAGKYTLSLPRPQQPPKGWAARIAHITMKTPQQLLLLGEEFLRVKAGHTRTQEGRPSPPLA